jgi:hypothetical protein
VLFSDLPFIKIGSAVQVLYSFELEDEPTVSVCHARQIIPCDWPNLTIENSKRILESPIEAQ